MTEAEFKSAMDELIAKTCRLFQEWTLLLLETTKIDYESMEGKYGGPKNLMTALCRHMAYEWRPLTTKDQKETKQMENDLIDLNQILRGLYERY